MKRTTIEARADGRAMTLDELRAFVEDTALVPGDVKVTVDVNFSRGIKKLSVAADEAP